MSSSEPMNMLCVYHVKKGKDKEFLQLLEKHWPALTGAGLVTEEPAQVFRCEDKMGMVYFVEKFSWKNAEAPGTAHQLPAVMAVWEPMGGLADKMAFGQVRQIPMPFANG